MHQTVCFYYCCCTRTLAAICCCDDRADRYGLRTTQSVSSSSSSIDIPGILPFRLGLLQKHAKVFEIRNGHTTSIAPHPVCSVKLSGVGPG